jgi:hypothetical protein
MLALHRRSLSWTTSPACCWLILLGALGILVPVRSESADRLQDEGRVEAHLAAGEFGPARALAERAAEPARRDAWLGRIAQAQLAAGGRRAALETTFDIQNDVLRSTTYGALTAQPAGGRGAAGGAALADFDTLINLITSTVAPETWDTVGGPGAVESFPTGVYVNASGDLKRLGVAAPGGELVELHRVAARGSSEDIRRESPLRKVSLTRLERHAQMLWAMGREPDEAMQCLAGMRRVQYILFYPETRDIVLAGPAGDWTQDDTGRRMHAESGAPLLRLDDFVVMLRNALEGRETFGCAITPSQENLAAVQAFLARPSATPRSRQGRQAWLEELRRQLGPQEIRVFGIDPRTHAARILVEADYHMKLIGMGLEEGTVGVESYLETVELGPDGRPPAMEVLRWWFTTSYDAVRTVAERNAFELVGPAVKVLSENEMLGERGERIHTGTSTDLNQRFAHSFTRHFEQLARQYPVYAELRNIFDLALVAALIHAEDMAGRIDWQLTHFGPRGPYTVPLGESPRRVESVVSQRVLGGRHWIAGVSGGVSVDLRQLVSASALRPDPYGRLEPSRARSAPRDLPRQKWWWD